MKRSSMPLRIRKSAVPLLCTPLLLSLAGAPALADEQPAVPDSLTGVFTGGHFNAVIRTYFFQRDFDDDTPDWASLAAGGNLNYETARVYNFTAGLGVKTSQGDLSDSDDQVYRGLLAIGDSPDDDESYTELDEYFLRYSNWNTTATFGAQAVSTPWIDGFDIRMTPRKYRGLTVKNTSFTNFEIQGMYILDWLDWAAEDWQSISAGITGNDDDDEGLLAGGLVWTPMAGLKLQFWDYYFNEVMNELYLKADYSRKIGEDYTFGLNLRYLDQADVGDGLGGDIDTYQAGGIISLAAFGGKLSLFYGEDGEDDIIAPFGVDKLVVMQVIHLDRADEDVLSVKFDYNFETLGLPGLTAYVFYSDFNTPDSGVNASPDIEELDFQVKYDFSGWLENFSIWFRQAFIDQDEAVAGGKDWTDSRLYLQYKF